MSIFKRTADMIEGKINKLLNRLENPNEMLDLSYEKMLSGLQEVKANIADVATEKKRLENKIAETQQDIAERDEQARAALKLGKEDLAKKALELKQEDNEKLIQLKSGFDRIAAQVDKLIQTEKNYQRKIEQFRSQKEITKATYQAAEAQVHVKESLSGIGSKLNNIGDVMQRAQEKNEEMTARAGALDDLTDAGVLSDPFTSGDDVKRELSKVKSDNAVADELARLKEELK